jgi:cytochrome c556
MAATRARSVMARMRGMTELRKTVGKYSLRSAFIGVCIASVPLALAHDGATGVVKERMELMSMLGKTMKSLKAIIRNTDPIDPSTLSRSAEAIRGHSGQMAGLFPAGSYDKPSEALPVIDDRRQEFDALFLELSDSAKRLAALAETPDRSAFAAWFRDTGRVCSNCHKIFRAAR